MDAWEVRRKNNNNLKKKNTHTHTEIRHISLRCSMLKQGRRTNVFDGGRHTRHARYGSVQFLATFFLAIHRHEQVPSSFPWSAYKQTSVQGRTCECLPYTQANKYCQGKTWSCVLSHIHTSSTGYRFKQLGWKLWSLWKKRELLQQCLLEHELVRC